jgi:hypothetical protein
MRAKSGTQGFRGGQTTVEETEGHREDWAKEGQRTVERGEGRRRDKEP